MTGIGKPVKPPAPAGPTAILHRPDPIMIVARACIRQIAIWTIELIGHIAASSANPVVIKPTDCKRRTIGKHEGFRRFIDPEVQVLFDARRSASSWRVYDHDFFC